MLMSTLKVVGFPVVQIDCIDLSHCYHSITDFGSSRFCCFFIIHHYNCGGKWTFLSEYNYSFDLKFQSSCLNDNIDT